MDIGILTFPVFYLMAAGLGITGQFMRGLLGLVKRFRDLGALDFNWAFFLVSLSMGGVAGLLGALVFDLRGVSPGALTADQLWDDRNFILMAVSAGYFGTDVIEGILGRYSPTRPADPRL